MPGRAGPLRRSVAVPRLASLTLLLVLLGAFPAHAHRQAGSRWPNRVITIFNGAPAYERAVATAIRTWNRARVGVRFQPAPKSRARLLIAYGRGRGGGSTGCEGVNGAAIIGYPGPAFLATVISIRRTCRDERLRTMTAVHELGHVLGLGHDDRRCAVMNSRISATTGVPGRCRGAAVARIRRSLIAPDDIRGARAIYREVPPRASSQVAVFSPAQGTRMRLASSPVAFSAGFRNRKLVYRWDFGDPASGASTPATGLDVRHRYHQPGRYAVTLAVIDGGAVIATQRHRITLF